MIWFIIVLSPQGVIEVIRRKWAKMTPKEKAPYEAMEAAFQKSQMTEMKQVFPEYCYYADIIVVWKERRERSDQSTQQILQSNLLVRKEV